MHIQDPENTGDIEVLRGEVSMLRLHKEEAERKEMLARQDLFAQINEAQEVEGGGAVCGGVLNV